MMQKCACVVYSGSETAVGAGQQLVIVVVVNAHPKLLGFKSMRGRPTIRHILPVFSYKHRITPYVLTLNYSLEISVRCIYCNLIFYVINECC